MTFAPATIRELGAYWTAHGGTNLGIVGDAPHVAGGVSYHLGRSDLREDAYSIVLQRDKAGLSEAASAIDLGKLNGSLFNLQVFSQWLVRQCQAHAPGTTDIREVIYTPNGLAPIHRWSEPDQKVYTGAGQGDLSHLTHTHISFYRDSEHRDKVGIFAPYFEATPPESDADPIPPEDPMPAQRYTQETYGTVTTVRQCKAMVLSEGTDLNVGEFMDVGPGGTWPSCYTAVIDGIADRAYVVAVNGTADPAKGYLLAFPQADVRFAFYPAPTPPTSADCSAVQAELNAANAKITAAQEALA